MKMGDKDDSGGNQELVSSGSFSGNEVGLFQVPKSNTEEQKVGGRTNPIVCELEILLSRYLYNTLERVMPGMVKLGYNKDIAEKTFSKYSLYGTEATVLNAVEKAVTFMKSEKELETSSSDRFPSLDKLVDLILRHMESEIKNVRSGLTDAEALWILLICDLNLKDASARVMDGNHSSGDNSGIPSDESLGEFIPQDERDKSIVKGYLDLKVLQNVINIWGEWVSEKVKQATERISKIQGQIKMLKQEKEEAERLKNGLSNTTDQLVIADGTIFMLENENCRLKISLDVAKEKLSRSTKNLEKDLQTGQEALKRCDAIYEQKKFLQEELTALKHQAERMRCQLETTEERKNQLEVAWDQEEKERQNYLSQADHYIRRKRKVKSPSSRDEYIKKLRDEIEICEWRLFFEKSIVGKRILDYDENYIKSSPGGNMAAAWQKSQERTATAVSKDNFRGGSITIKPERECVICSTEEASVLFLPCAHQVLCEGCNEESRNHCPSCKTEIVERIQVRFEGY